jgi:hypothetical protein
MSFTATKWAWAAPCSATTKLVLLAVAFEAETGGGLKAADNCLWQASRQFHSLYIFTIISACYYLKL